MFFRLLLDWALVAALSLEPNAGAPRTTTSVPTLDPSRGAPRGITSGPRPPKKPPEKRPHDSSWSEIKSRLGRRP